MKSLFLSIFLAACCDPVSPDPTIPVNNPTTYRITNVSITVGLQDPFTGFYWDGTTAQDVSLPDLYLGDEEGKPWLPDFWTAYDQTHVVWPLAGPEDVIQRQELTITVWDKDLVEPQWVWGCSVDRKALENNSNILSCRAYDMELYATIVPCIE